MTQQDAAPNESQGPAPAPGAAVPPPPPAPKQKSKVLRVVIGLALAVVVFGVALYFAQSEPGNAKVGDCVSGTSAEELEIVECSAPEAESKVVGRVENKSEAQASTSCTKFKDARQAFWQGKPGEKGLVLCLAPAS
ncbi:MAG: LppU/SCO3897 family protein [Micromonosporaceae bacterium]